MPEGPEVKRVVDFLCQFDGKFLHDVEILSGRYSRHGPFEGFYDLKKLLPLKILNVNCHGKFIYFYFSNDASLWCTLGMSGAWLNHQRKHARAQADMTYCALASTRARASRLPAGCHRLASEHTHGHTHIYYVASPRS